MSARHMLYTPRTKMLVKLAVQLGRENSGRFRTLEEIAEDAAAILTAGEEARKALSGGRSPAPAFAKAAKVAAVYDARVVEQDIETGTVLSLRFTSGRYGTPGALFHVS
jgi:hypothetical protein